MLYHPALLSGFCARLVLAAVLMIPMTPSAGDDANTMSEAIHPNLTAAHSDELEATVASTPGDVHARARLIGYYFQQHSPKRFPHVLWMIEHEPASDLVGSGLCSILKWTDPASYAEGAKLWSARLAVETPSPKILLNAATYYIVNDQEACEQALAAGHLLYPSQADFPAALARLYRLSGPTKSTLTFSMFEQALSLTTTEIDRFYLLADVVKAAIAANEVEKARTYANDLLALAGKFDDWNTGNAIHIGNLVLGLIAVRDKDLDAACELLLKAGKTRGSPQLDSFGPNMSLAKELLDLGRKDAVLTFLDLCKVFWDKPELMTWRKDIVTGGTPNFGANLNY
jgi:hypothetical protein